MERAKRTREEETEGERDIERKRQMEEGRDGKRKRQL